MTSLLDYLAFQGKDKVEDLLPWPQQILDF